MPNEGMKISQLPAATEVLDSDVLAGVGGGVTRKFTFATIASYISAKLTALFAAKQDKITANGVLQGDGDGDVTARNVDATPTASSTNLITSGGVKSALDEKQDAIHAQYSIQNGYYREFSVPISGQWMIADVSIGDILLMRTTSSGTGGGIWLSNGETINNGHPSRYSYSNSTKKLTITNTSSIYENVSVFSLNSKPFTADSPQPISSSP